MVANTKELGIPAPPKLRSKENYSLWSRQVRIHLQGRSLFGHCDGTAPAPHVPMYDQYLRDLETY
jgi:gag-polypeptide of LTR copia-type